MQPPRLSSRQLQQLHERGNSIQYCSNVPNVKVVTPLQGLKFLVLNKRLTHYHDSRSR